MRLVNRRERGHLENRRRREDNIKMDLQDMGRQGMDLIHLTEDKGEVAGFCVQANEHSGQQNLGKNS